MGRGGGEWMGVKRGERRQTTSLTFDSCVFLTPTPRFLFLLRPIRNPEFADGSLRIDEYSVPQPDGPVDFSVAIRLVFFLLFRFESSYSKFGRLEVWMPIYKHVYEYRQCVYIFFLYLLRRSRGWFQLWYAKISIEAYLLSCERFKFSVQTKRETERDDSTFIALPRHGAENKFQLQQHNKQHNK